MVFSSCPSDKDTVTWNHIKIQTKLHTSERFAVLLGGESCMSFPSKPHPKDLGVLKVCTESEL